MEYAIQKLAKLSGISTRTLRYYHEMGLLEPRRINSAGYRIYGQQEVDKLQQILFYRELEVSLSRIKEIVNSPSFDGQNALKQHLTELLEKRKQINLLIENVKKTINSGKGKMDMNDNEKFEGFKQKLVADNEEKYGKEIREKYGKEEVERSNMQFKNMTKAQYEELESLRKEIDLKLGEAFKTGEPSGALAQEVCALHKEWITRCWGHYSREAHMGLAEMYVEDPRFTANYDKIAEGCTVFLRDAMRIFTGITE